jgi:hypothetical protein
MGECEPEVSPLSRFRFHPDLPSVPVDDLAADGQSYARALVLGPAMQTPERLEDLPGIIRLNTNAVVFDPEYLGTLSLLEGQLDDWTPISAELQGITDKILVELRN